MKQHIIGLRRLLTLGLALLLTLYAPLALTDGAVTADEAVESTATTLVVVFSHAGENYNVGVIEEGNTLKMAWQLAGMTSADLFEIVPVVPYPEDYDACLDAATSEQRSGARPEYEGEIADEDWSRYDTVFIGYPIWWGEIPNIVYTFMEAHDFNGKTVVPFNTHEGSGQAHSQRDIEALMGDDVTVLNGLAVRGSRAQTDVEGTAADIAAWLDGIGIEYVIDNAEAAQ